MSQKDKWRWIGLDVAYAIHDRQIAEHGGFDGIRDVGAVEPTLNKPRNLALYEEPDAAALAASCAYGPVRNHDFSDGNKRTAWVIARLFLADNGYRLRFDHIGAARMVEALAAGKMDEKQLAEWFRERTTAEKI